MAKVDNFAVEEGKEEKAVSWMNSYAKKNNQKFEAKLEGYRINTIKFGSFEVISWRGDWSAARKIMLKASEKLNMRILEAGYHEKGDLISSFFRRSDEFAKVYRSGNLIGNLKLDLKSGKWTVKSERSA